jgi:hypothetical protein
MPRSRPPSPGSTQTTWGAYYDVKDPVCDLVMDAAERWAADVDWAAPTR